MIARQFKTAKIYTGQRGSYQILDKQLKLIPETPRKKILRVKLRELKR